MATHSGYEFNELYEITNLPAGLNSLISFSYIRNETSTKPSGKQVLVA